MQQRRLALGDVEVDVVSGRAPQAVDGGVVLSGRAVRVGYPGTARAFYRHGWQSWSQTRWLELDEPVWRVPVPELHPFDDDPAHADATRHGGAWVGALDGDGHVLLVGALGLDGRVELVGAPAAALVASGEATDEWFVAYGTEHDVFAAYAGHLGRHLGRRDQADLRVWCSWYSFYTGVTEPALDAVLADLEGLAFDVVQIDDGWQREIGDWRANHEFPSGMPASAARIRDTGRRPGLWLAPFLVHERSEVAATHPDWLLRDAAGAPVPAGWNWGGRVHALDVTRPDVLAHVVDDVRAAAGWGFDYLKLDFLYAAALPGVRHAEVERHRAYRRAVEALRDAVGDDVLLLACGAPIVPSLGVFDAIRVGPDVAELWENHAATRYLHHVSGPQTRYAIATSAHRLWLRPLIGVDPDVAYFRTRHCLLTDAQKALLADLTRVCGFRATSDVPATLDPHERTALAAYLDERSRVEPVDRYRWKIDGREVDFGPVAAAPPEFRPLEG